jgi:ElaB/YqjD/DUF883 family membrane-anchored ribosome-binding protein
MSTSTTATPTGSSSASDSEFGGDDESSVTAKLESNRVLQKLREKTDSVVESIQPKIAAVSSYARNEPTKAVLIAAASGAALMALVALLVRSSRPSSPGARTMAAIRDAAIDLADRAHSVATDAIATTHKHASDAIASTHKHASDAKDRVDAAQKRAGEVADSVAETWANLREQAAPVVERFKPQIDAVASYAKEDPARAALGVATAGAVLVGLLALIRRSGS